MAMTPRPDQVLPWITLAQQLSNKLGKEYELSYDSAYSASRSVSENGIRELGGVSDPTGRIATSSYHENIRSKTKQAARCVMRAALLLEEANSCLAGWHQ